MASISDTLENNDESKGLNNFLTSYLILNYKKHILTTFIYYLLVKLFISVKAATF